MKHLNKNQTLLFSLLLSLVIVIYLLGLLSSWIFPLTSKIEEPLFHNITYSMFITFWTLTILVNIALFFVNNVSVNLIKRKVNSYVLSFILALIFLIIISFIYFKLEIYPIYSHFYRKPTKLYLSIFPSQAYFLAITFIYGIFIWIVSDMFHQHLTLIKFLQTTKSLELKTSKENEFLKANETILSTEKFENSKLLIDTKANQLYFTDLEKVLNKEEQDKFSYSLNIKKVKKDALNFEISYTSKTKTLIIKCDWNNESKSLILLYNNNGKWNNETVKMEAK